MANQGPPPSSTMPPSMGPGARPVQPGDASPGAGLAEIMNIRSSYRIHVQDDTLNLGYELNGNTRTQRLPFDSIPLSSFRRWLLYGGPKRAFAAGVQTIDSIRGAENMAGRQVTQREAEGFAFYASKRTFYNISGNIVGCLAGGAIAYRTRENMKFPFRTAQPLERYNNFPNRYVPILTGSYARLTWQITRANVWAVLCLFVTAPFFKSMGDVSMMTGLYRDDRTKDIVSEMKGSLERIASNRSKAARPRRTQPTETRTDQQGQDQDQGQGPNADQYPQDWERNAPTNDYSGSRDYKGDGESDRMERIQGIRRDTDGISDRPGRPAPQRDSTPQRDAPTAADSDVFFYDDDDASPTAGNRPNSARKAPYDRSRGGSVWERIRRGGTPGASDQPAQQKDPSSPSSSPSPRGWNRSGQQQDTQFENSSDSFSFSRTEADKQFAREQAQKEFDEMLDRERKESGSDDYDRGMRAVETGQESQAASGMSAWEQRRRRS